MARTLLLFVVAVVDVLLTQALDNGMGLLPIRGVSSWCVQGEVRSLMYEASHSRLLQWRSMVQQRVCAHMQQVLVRVGECMR